MLSFLINLFAFLFALSVLITVHEFGHFWLARLCGVKVLRFCIGFGKILASRRDRHGTEFAIALVPLGGYVKMLDEREAPVAQQDRPYAFNRKSLLQRTSVVLAGPLFNFIFAIFAFWALYLLGVKEYTPYINTVHAGSVAEQAGVPENAEILAIDGVATRSWRAVLLASMRRLGDVGHMTVMLRNPHDQSKQLYQLDLAKAQASGEEPSLLEGLGLTLGMPKVPALLGDITAGEAAAKAGLRAGDQIVRAADKPIKDWFDFVTVVRSRAGLPLPIVYLRDGVQHEGVLVAREKIGQDGQKMGYIGAQLAQSVWPDNWERLQHYDFIPAFKEAVKQTWGLTTLTLSVLGKMVLGQADSRNISGPILIAKEAGESARYGMRYFVSFLALISVSLGVVNLLPIPLLDGGHLLYYLIEWISGKPASEGQLKVGNTIGLCIIFFVMVLAIYNDFARL